LNERSRDIRDASQSEKLCRCVEACSNFPQRYCNFDEHSFVRYVNVGNQYECQTNTSWLMSSTGNPTGNRGAFFVIIEKVI
jgi:hypothetical protein